MNTQSTTTEKKIVGYGVYYAPTREGKLFAGLKPELIGAFHRHEDAIKLCESENMAGVLDELHYGYVVYPLNWIPKGVTLV